MGLREQLQADVKEAMRSGETSRRDTLRSLLAAIKQAEIDGQTTLDEAGLQAVVKKQAKQRRESIADYKKAGRDDLIAKEADELAIIETYLPQMMSREEVEVIAAKVIAELNVTDIKGMGQVMGRLMGQLKGKADGGMVNAVVRDLLK